MAATAVMKIEKRGYSMALRLVLINTRGIYQKKEDYN